MRKQRKTTIMKRPSPIIGAKGGTFGSNKLMSHSGSAPVGFEAEAALMAKEERDQRKYDRFWGLDKDSQDRVAERASMGREDVSSQQNELFCKQTDLQRKWDREFHRKVLYENRANALEKEQERQQYLKFLSFAESSEEVISRVWNQSEQSLPAFQPATSQSTIGGSTLSLPNASSLVGTSVHVDGLQKSRAIVNEAAFSFRETLRKLNSLAPSAHGSPQNANKTAGLEEPNIENTTVNRGSPTMSVTGMDRNPFVSSKTKLNEKVKQLFNEEIDPTKLAKAPVHNELIDGHALHKWDQELLLQTAFSRLDKGGKGYLTRTDILTISHDRSVHSLLKFTVFWSFIKKKQWYFFESLFDACSESKRVGVGGGGGHVSFSNTKNKQQLTPLVNRADGNSLHNVEADGYNQDTILTEEIPYIDCIAWLEAATNVSTDSGVPPRHIRSHEEHLCVSGGSKKHGTEKVASGTAQQQQLLRVSLPERESRLVRKIGVGDCVWALHRSGVVWLPAVVTYISSGSPDTNDGSGNHDEEFGEVREIGYRYNLQFPLNERELQRARATAASRALLELPSQNDSGCIRPKPFESERAANAYAFDLCDATGIGAVELHALVATLHSAEFKKVVQTSVALQIIFGKGTMQTRAPTVELVASGRDNGEKSDFFGSSLLDTELIPCLLPVFLDTFSFSASEAESCPVSGSRISTASSWKKSNHNRSNGLSDSENDEYDDDDEDKYSASFESSSVAPVDKSQQQQKESKAVDFVSKADFLEFCDAVLDLKVYSIKSIGVQQ